MLFKPISRHPSTIAYRSRVARANQTQVQVVWSTQTLRFLNAAAGVPVPRKRKVWDSVDEAIKDVKPGDTLLSGGSSDWVLHIFAVVTRYFLHRIRTLRDSGYSHWSPCKEDRRQESHCRLEQRRIRRTWVGCVRSDRSRLILGRLTVPPCLFFHRQTSVC